MGFSVISNRSTQAVFFFKKNVIFHARNTFFSTHLFHRRKKKKKKKRNTVKIRINKLYTHKQADYNFDPKKCLKFKNLNISFKTTSPFASHIIVVELIIQNITYSRARKKNTIFEYKKRKLFSLNHAPPP